MDCFQHFPSRERNMDPSPTGKQAGCLGEQIVLNLYVYDKLDTTAAYCGQPVEVFSTVIVASAASAPDSAGGRSSLRCFEIPHQRVFRVPIRRARVARGQDLVASRPRRGAKQRSVLARLPFVVEYNNDWAYDHPATVLSAIETVVIPPPATVAAGARPSSGIETPRKNKAFHQPPYTNWRPKP